MVAPGELSIMIGFAELCSLILFQLSDHIITSAQRNHIFKLITKFALLSCRVKYTSFNHSMKESILRTKSKAFAKEIILICRKLKSNQIEYALINQLLRCGTSVGANIHEAQYAQGTKDFISKLEIALKECNESDYWIELLFETNSLSEEDYEDLSSRIIEIRRMLVSSVTTLKKNQL